jgi:hypothetical protein
MSVQPVSERLGNAQRSFLRARLFIDHGQRELSPSVALTWLTLNRFANGDGLTFVGPKRVAAARGIGDVRTIKRHFQVLREAGFLTPRNILDDKNRACRRLLVPDVMPPTETV